jgi:phosphoribosylanthranilate isomerase
VTRIKCCGMTRVEDAVLAAQLGVDAIGMVFTARSKRCVSVAQGRAIVDALPPFVSTVALFMDDEASLVREMLDEVRPTLLQFHGDESDAWCMQFGHPFLKAIAMGGGAAAAPRFREHPHAAAILLDGHGLGEAGGSGKTFDWRLLPADLGCPVMLAGGLDADNVSAAIRMARPWAVDVASGVESAPGIKDARKLSAFVRAVREVDVERATSIR